MLMMVVLLMMMTKVLMMMMMVSIPICLNPPTTAAHPFPKQVPAVGSQSVTRHNLHFLSSVRSSWRTQADDLYILEFSFPRSTTFVILAKQSQWKSFSWTGLTNSLHLPSAFGTIKYTISCLQCHIHPNPKFCLKCFDRLKREKLLLFILPIWWVGVEDWKPRLVGCCLIVKHLTKSWSILSCYSDVVIEHKGRPGILSSHRGGWRPCRRPWRWSASLASSTLLSSLQLNLPPVHLDTINTLIRRDQFTYHHDADATDNTLSPPIQPKRLDPSRTTGSTLSDLWLPFDLIAIMINRVLMQPIIATK